MIQAKVNEGKSEDGEKESQELNYNIIRTQKAEILDECRELIEDILDKKTSRI